MDAFFGNLLLEFIEYLNPALDPVTLYLSDLPVTGYPDSPAAWACSRDFEFARLALTPDCVILSPMVLNESDRHRHPHVRFEYADPNMFAALGRRLLELSDEVVTPGWSDHEIAEWEERGWKKMVADFPRLGKYAPWLRRSSSRSLDVHHHRSSLSPDRIEQMIRRLS